MLEKPWVISARISAVADWIVAPWPGAGATWTRQDHTVAAHVGMGSWNHAFLLISMVTSLVVGICSCPSLFPLTIESLLEPRARVVSMARLLSLAS